MEQLYILHQDQVVKFMIKKMQKVLKNLLNILKTIVNVGIDLKDIYFDVIQVIVKIWQQKIDIFGHQQRHLNI